MCESDSMRKKTGLAAADGKVLYLHTGFPKTGTTALQNFFAINGPALESLGVRYAEAGRLKQEWKQGKLQWLRNKLAKAVNRHLAEQHHPLFGPITKGSRIKPWDWNHSLELLRKEVESSAFSKFLCSSELLNQGIDFTELPRLYEIFDHIKAVVYVRRQDGFISSLYEQAVKSYGLDGVFNYEERLGRAPDYCNVLAQWDALVAGRGEVIVCPYEKQQFHGSDIYSDFFYRVFNVDIDTSQYDIPTYNPNPRLTRDALELKRLINRCCEPKKSIQFLGGLLGYSKAHAPETAMPFTMRSLLSPEQNLNICLHFEQSNEHVARQYLGREDGRLFYEPLPVLDDLWESYHGLMPETIEDIIRFWEKEHVPLIGLLRELLKSLPDGIPAEDVLSLNVMQNIIAK